jgi:hypothetical protein
MSDLGDSWRDLREESQQHRRKKQKDNTEVVMHIAGEYVFSVKVLSDHHLRLSHPGGRPLDYFPQRGKATWLGTNRWFTIKDIEAFIMDNWEKEPDYCDFCKGTDIGASPDVTCSYCDKGIKCKPKEIDI